MKAYTNLEQSKRLAEFLPLESADTIWDLTIPDLPTIRAIPYEDSDYNNKYLNIMPAWSLAALIDILAFPQLSKDTLGSGKVGWMVSVYPDNCRYDSCWHDNPVDACYEMIIKLHELKML